MLVVVAVIIAVIAVSFGAGTRRTNGDAARTAKPKSSPKSPHVSVHRPKESPVPAAAPAPGESEADAAGFEEEESVEEGEIPEELASLRVLLPGSLGESEVARVKRMAEKCPRPPTLLGDVMGQLSLGSYDVRKFSDFAHRDAILASQILRTVNSAFFGMKNEVTSVQRAVVLLGFNNVKDIALKLALDKVFVAGNPALKEAYSKFWLASFASSSVCAIAARVLDMPKGSELSTSALLSYLGNFAFIANHPDDCGEYLSQDGLIGRVKFEQEKCGANSALIGGVLASAWSLPPSVNANIEHSLVPLAVSAAQCPPEMRESLALCYVSSRVGDHFAFGGIGSFEEFDFESLDGPEHFHIKSYMRTGALKRFAGIFKDRQLVRELDKTILATIETLATAGAA